MASLTETLHKKETEMAGMEERYKKYIEKAKSVIKTLDPKQNPNAGGDNPHPLPTPEELLLFARSPLPQHHQLLK